MKLVVKPRWAWFTLPMLVAVLGIVVSATAMYMVERRNQADAQEDFDRKVNRLEQEVVRRFERPALGLVGTRALFVAHAQLQREVFARAIASRQLDSEFPGVRGLGFIERVPRARLDSFLARERADGAPAFTLRQLNDKHLDPLYVIKLIEPLSRNGPAVGLDVGSEAHRREAVERAIVSGATTITKPIVLVQDGRQSPGFLICLPVYEGGVTPRSRGERERLALGVVYSPVVAAELLAGAADAAFGHVDFELFSGQGQLSAATLVYDDDGHLAGNADQVVDAQDYVGRRFVQSRGLEIHGQMFTLQLSSTPKLPAQSAQPWSVLAAGLFITALLVVVSAQAAHRATMAERLAQSMSEDLKRLALVAKRTSNAVVITDAQRRITWVNEGFERITGYSLAEVVGRRPREVLQVDDADTLTTTRLREALERAQPVRAELRNRRKDGQWYWIDIEIQPLRNAEGVVDGFMAVETDITERRQAAEVLATERRRLQDILDGTRAGTWMHDLVSGDTTVNHIYTEMLGYSVDEWKALGSSAFRDHLCPEDLGAFERHWASHLGGESAYFYAELRMRHREGRWVWVQSRGRISERDAEGRPRVVSGIHVDVSARKEAERELSRSRQGLANIIEGTNVGTWEWNVETGETRFNERWAQIVGYTLAELGPTDINTWMRLAHPDDLARSGDLLQRHFNGELESYECEARMRHRDGHWVWVLDRGKLFSRTESGAPRWMAGTHMDITDRKRAEAALRASQDFLDKTGRIAAVGGWSYDGSTGLFEWTDQACRLHDMPPGYRPTLEQALAFLAPQVREDVRVVLQLCIDHAQPFDLEVPATTANGRFVWLRMLGEPAPEGERTAVVAGAVQDVTASHELALEVERRKELLDTVIEFLPCGLTVFDANLVLQVANRETARLLEWTPEMMVTGLARFEDLVRFNARRGDYGGTDPEAAALAVIHRVKGQKVVPHRFERAGPNGSTLEIRGAPLPSGGFVTTYTDITERRRLEAEHDKARALLEGAIEAVDEAFVLYDSDDRLVLCNQKYRELYAGIADLMVPGVTFEALVRAGAQRGDYTAAIGRVDEWVAERVAQHQAADGRVLIQKLENGRTLRIIERRLDNGYIVGFRVDVTELERAREEAVAASVAKSQFLANMSHEIRTPMNAILGMLTLLRRTELAPRQAEYAAKTEGAARSLLHLLNDILDFSKVEAGKMTLDPQPFELDALLRDLSVILSGNVGAKPVELLFDVSPGLPRWLRGDSMRLQQVLINLGGNAVKFTERGEVVISVQRVRQDEQMAVLRFEVRDTGIGIAPENQARIFAGFTQAEASTTRRFGGTGLGVVICQRLVGLMGGQLLLDSALGQGSRFYFELVLPVADPPADAREVISLATDASQTTLHALVVDDNPTARELMVRMCESLGWSTVGVGSGRDALDQLAAASNAAQRFDAVFLDWQMPDLDGWDTLQQIRTRKLAKDAPVVVMVTAHGREMLEKRSPAEQAALDGFLVKPVTASMLLDAVVEARDGRLPSLMPPAAAAPGTLRLEGVRVLLVEDNENNQQVATELLSDEGAQVQVASNGQEAVETVSASPSAFDVVLMDLQMPVMDGYTATARIRKDLGLSALPIVAMTANALASDREACLAAGMNDHVGKPFDLDQLVRVILKQTGRSLVGLTGGEAQSGTSALPDAVLRLASACGMDMPAALQRMGGNVKAYRRALERFVNDLTSMLGEARGQWQAGDLVNAARTMHTLKGLAATLGLTELARHAAQAEAPLRGGAVLGTSLASALEHSASQWLAAWPGLSAAWGSETAERPPEGATRALDAQAVSEDLRRLAALLADADMEALACAEHLVATHPVQDWPQWGTLDAALQSLDFEAARQCAQDLIKELDA